MSARPNYGQDSPGIVATLFALAIGVSSAIPFVHSAWRWVLTGVGVYFLLGAFGMLYYSRFGKIGLRDRLLEKISWRGDEKVLDVGCGRGLLTVGVARRLSNGSVTGVDVWVPTAVSGNRSDSVLENARIEHVGDRVSIQEGDARKLPFPDGVFDVVVSNFVVHELQLPADRVKMMSEIARVLKRGGRVALADFIFTDECVANLRKSGVQAERARDGSLSFWITAILNFGLVRTYFIIGKKES